MEYVLNIFAKQYKTQHPQEILLEHNNVMVLLILSTAIAVLCDISRVPFTNLPSGTSLRAWLDLLNPHKSFSLVNGQSVD